MKRYFTNTKAGSNKFWCAELTNKTLIIVFGRPGTAGRQLKKEFANKAICKVQADKLIKEKIKKGYTEVKKLAVVLPQSFSHFSPSTEKTFWQLINISLQKTNLAQQANLLTKELKKLSKKDLAAFENIYNRLDNACYTWNLWAAAYTIHGGCSDDSFTDFRAWLITRGETIYTKALASSDSLSSLKRKQLQSIDDNKYIKPFKRKIKPSG